MNQIRNVRHISWGACVQSVYNGRGPGGSSNVRCKSVWRIIVNARLLYYNNVFIIIIYYYYEGSYYSEPQSDKSSDISPYKTCC